MTTPTTSNFSEELNAAEELHRRWYFSDRHLNNEVPGWWVRLVETLRTADRHGYEVKCEWYDATPDGGEVRTCDLDRFIGPSECFSVSYDDKVIHLLDL